MKPKIIGFYRFTIPPDTLRKLPGNSHQTAAAAPRLPFAAAFTLRTLSCQVSST